jgi:hypothetical protein
MEDFQKWLKCHFENSLTTSYSISKCEEVMLSFLMKILEWQKVSGLKIFLNGNSNLFKSLFISLNGRRHIIFTLGFCI